MTQFNEITNIYFNLLLYSNNSINANAKKKFIGYLSETFYQMKLNYKAVVITDGFRNTNLQMIRMTQTKSLDYYLGKVTLGGESWYYINLIKYLYESNMTKEEMIILLETNNTDLIQHRYITDRGKNIITEYLSPQNFSSLQETLEEMLKEPRVFTPSNHMLSQALDLSILDDLKETAETLLKIAGQKYQSDHIHLNLD